MTNEEKQKLGTEWAEILGLEPVNDPNYVKQRYITTWGSKTGLGIYLTIMSLVETQQVADRR